MVLPEGIFSSNWAADEPAVELAKLLLTFCVIGTIGLNFRVVLDDVTADDLEGDQKKVHKRF